MRIMNDWTTEVRSSTAYGYFKFNLTQCEPENPLALSPDRPPTSTAKREVTGVGLELDSGARGANGSAIDM
jgi:hypothetical protein